MTILPIIYSSILIFSGILVFVVIISYVSFKIKGDSKYFEEEEKVKHNISIPPVRQLRKEALQMAYAHEKEDIIKKKYLHDKNLKSVSPKLKSDHRIKAKKRDEKNIEVLYKEKDLFNRSKPRLHEPRFSVVTDISEHLVKFDNTELRADGASYQTSHMVEVGSVDYLKFYENY